ncbi:MAG: hypothetical protein QGH13_05510 [Candidatus Thalassarchaeaceae archaeon]|nr:hypothetical protein [Candidatus Thalassarchaeaceae archaeon]
MAVNQSVGRTDDLETLSLRFQQYVPGGTANVWRMAEPSQFNGPFAMNYSARQAAGGLIPSLASEGALIAATLPENPLPAGTHAWLTSASSPIPSAANEWRISFNHWYHLHSTNNSIGSSGAWVEVSLDGGSTWTWIEPIGGYTWNISVSAPIPNGAPSQGFGVFGGTNSSGWINSTFDISHLNITNATSMQHRFVVWTDPSGQVDRPGWYVDEVTVSNLGDTPGSWFHGSLTGEYAPDAYAHLTLPVQLNVSQGTSGAWMLRYWSDFDLEGGTWDNFEVKISADNLSWYRVSPVGGIPGPYGLTVGGQTIMEDSEGWVEIAHPFPASFSIPNNGSIYLRFEVETDQMPSSGYGGTLDAPEGVFIDDLQITQTTNGQTRVHWFENLTGDASAVHNTMAGGSHDQWQHLTSWGNNGPFEQSWSFEEAPSIADGWNVHTDYGQSWEFGAVSNSSGWGPGSWPSGSTGVAMGLIDRHQALTWTHLISPSYHVPLGASARVIFDHFICTESGWDGGALYTSIDNGTSWQQFGMGIPDFYDQQHYNNLQSPFYGKWAWDGSNKKGSCQTNKTFDHMEADISNFGGQDIMLRFSFFADTFYEYDGWYLDDVGIVIDWFETEGTWTSPLLIDNDYSFSPTLDIDANIPDGTWVTASILDENGAQLQNGWPIAENSSFPALYGGESYHIELRFGTNNRELTPRINGLYEGAIRIFNAADGNNGWDFPYDIVHNRQNGNLTNPTLVTHSIEGSAAYGDAPIKAVEIIAEAAGALFEIRDGQGIIIASGSLTNKTIQLPYSAVNIRPTIKLQPGGWIRHTSFIGHLGAPMNNGTIDVGGDGLNDWTWSNEIADSFGWFDGCSQCINGSITSVTTWQTPGVMVDEGTVLQAQSNISWTWINGVQDSMVSGEVRILEHPWTEIQNQSNPAHFTFVPIATSWESTISITNLGSHLRLIQNDALNGTGPGQIISGNVHIPIVLSADQGGVKIVEGGIIHAQRIVNEIISVPVGTMIPEQNVTIVTQHSHLLGHSLFDAIDLRMESSEGKHIEMRIEDIWGTSQAIQRSGSTEMLLSDVNISLIGTETIRVAWNLQTQWAFDDQAWILVLAEAVEVDGFTLGPAHGMIGGSNHLAMENDLEVISWDVRDSDSRLLSNTWDSRYPFYVTADSQIDVTGVVRFEGVANAHPSHDSFSVALEAISGNTSSKSIGMTGLDGTWSASIVVPHEAGNVTVSPWIVSIGPPGTSVLGAEDVSGGEIEVEVRVDTNAPEVGTLMLHTPQGGRPANGNVVSSTQIIPLWIEITDSELLSSFITLRCWLESINDIDGDNAPDDFEYGTYTQFIGGLPSGTMRIDFPALYPQGMSDGEQISCYIEGSDYAGHAIVGAGGPGFDNDMATFTVESQLPTQVSLSSLSLDRNSDMSLLQGVKHTFSFSIIDGNGLSSIDSIDLLLTGDEQGALHFDPLTYQLSAPENSHIVPFAARVSDLGSNAYDVEFDFAINLTAPTNWQEGAWIPDLVVTESGEVVSQNTLGLEAFSWALDHRLMWVIDDATDLTFPAMPMFENRLNLQPGDSMSLSASINHRETLIPIDIDLPDGSKSSIEILGGEHYSENYSIVGNEFDAVLNMDDEIWPGPIATILIGLEDSSEYNISLPQLSFEIAIDNVPPELEFQSSSLILLQSDHLTGQLISFTVEDAGGMGDQPLVVKWSYRRYGVDISGAQGSAMMNLGSHTGHQWTYSEYVDLTPMASLGVDDSLVIWIEGNDLAGNPLVGFGTQNSPRSPILQVMHFSPILESVWVEPKRPEVGDMIQIDARITNLGNLDGSVEIGLWAWEQQSNGPDQLIRLEDYNLSLSPSKSFLLGFEFEAWREGDLQVYLVLDGQSESRVSVDIPPIREQGAGDTFTQRVFGDGPFMIGLLMIFWCGLGFVIAILWMGRRDITEEEWDDHDLDNVEIESKAENWPEPPTHFPDESPPPIPKDLLDDSREEE